MCSTIETTQNLKCSTIWTFQVTHLNRSCLQTNKVWGYIVPKSSTIAWGIEEIFCVYFLKMNKEKNPCQVINKLNLNRTRCKFTLQPLQTFSVSCQPSLVTLPSNLQLKAVSRYSISLYHASWSYLYGQLDMCKQEESKDERVLGDFFQREILRRDWYQNVIDL